jgi:ATP-dependent Lon protease
MFKLTRSKDEHRNTGGSFAMPLLPLRDIVVFPGMVAPLFVGRDKSVNALEKAMASDKKIFLSAQTKAKTDTPGESDIYRVGTVGTSSRY